MADDAHHADSPKRSSLQDELARMGLHTDPDPTGELPVPPPEQAVNGDAPPPFTEAAAQAVPDPAADEAGSEPLDDGDTPEPGWAAEPPAYRPTSADLTPESVLRRRVRRPKRGWRRAVYIATGGRVNPGPSASELRERELRIRARTPVTRCHRLAVISLKGGVGKTTTTAALGGVLASLRGDRVVAVDANPDRGTLGERVADEYRASVRDLLAAREDILRYGDVREFTAHAQSRLEVLSSDSDPSASLAFSEEDYRSALDILERFYNVVLTDCGTGLLHSAMRGVLGLADSLVVISSSNLDGARSASATLDWLEAHGYGEMARRAVTVISAVRPTEGEVDIDRLEQHFAARCRAVLRVPYDPHLAVGGVIDVDAMRKPTRKAYLELAAAVGDGMTTTAAPRVRA